MESELARKDRRLISLQREVKEFEKAVEKAKGDTKEQAFRKQQLDRAKSALARYIQNQHPEK